MHTTEEPCPETSESAPRHHPSSDGSTSGLISTPPGDTTWRRKTDLAAPTQARITDVCLSVDQRKWWSSSNYTTTNDWYRNRIWCVHWKKLQKNSIECTLLKDDDRSFSAQRRPYASEHTTKRNPFLGSNQGRANQSVNNCRSWERIHGSKRGTVSEDDGRRLEPRTRAPQCNWRICPSGRGGGGRDFTFHIIDRSGRIESKRCYKDNTP